MIVSSGNRRGSRKAEILQLETGKSIHGTFEHMMASGIHFISRLSMFAYDSCFALTVVHR